METRKVQMTGGSSFVITLPKDCINSLKIKKNDPLGLVVQSDGTLLITPKSDSRDDERLKEFDVDDVDDPKFMKEATELVEEIMDRHGINKAKWL